MPEGHSVHRHARKLNELFADKNLKISSPQGRFAGGAEVLNHRKLIKAKAHGKQLFAEFEGKAFLRVHLGIYGKWGFRSYSETPPEPVGQVRLRIASETDLADLRGPTACEVLTSVEVRKITSRLGPDPLQPDPKKLKKQDFINRVSKSQVSVGQLLMNQEIIAGIGNVYRAELLFRAGQSPFTPGRDVSSEVLETIWDNAQRLMKIGVKKGIMLTREDKLRGRPKVADRYYVYKRQGLRCRECGGMVSIALMQARKLYWCPACQA
mgnify:FL=1